jgi:hypothetical protein
MDLRFSIPVPVNKHLCSWQFMNYKLLAFYHLPDKLLPKSDIGRQTTDLLLSLPSHFFSDNLWQSQFGTSLPLSLCLSS